MPADEFYQNALIRDSALVNNMLEKMTDENNDLAVMVTGGFHTEGITDILKNKGVGYAVISPKITKVQEDCPYMSLMMDKNINSIEKDVKNNMLSTPEYLSPTNQLRQQLKGLPELGEQLAEELADQIDDLLRQKEKGAISDRDIERKLNEMIDRYKSSRLVSKILEDLKRTMLQEERSSNTGAIEKTGGGQMKKIGIGNEREYSSEDRERFKKSKVITVKKRFLRDVFHKKNLLSMNEIKSKIERLEEAYGKHMNIIVVEANLEDDEAYHFIEDNTLYIVLNKVGYGVKDELIRIEDIFHELCEAFWMKEIPIDDKDRKHKAHVRASAEEVSQFSNGGRQITPAHKAMLDSMTTYELLELFKENRIKHMVWLDYFKNNDRRETVYYQKVRDDNNEYYLTFYGYIKERFSKLAKIDNGLFEDVNDTIVKLIAAEFLGTGIWSLFYPLKMAMENGRFKKILHEIITLIMEHHILISEEKIGFFFKFISHLMTEDDYVSLTDTVLGNLRNTTIDNPQRENLLCLLDKAYITANDSNKKILLQAVFKGFEEGVINGQLIGGLRNILTYSAGPDNEAHIRQILKKGIAELNSKFDIPVDNTGTVLSHKETEEVMKTCKAILEIFMSKIDTCISSNNLEVLKDIVQYLNSLAEDESINVKIRSEVIRALVGILQKEGIPNKEEILLPKILYENMSESEQESRGLSIPPILYSAVSKAHRPETPREEILNALKHIKDKNYDVRIGYRILLVCKDRKDILDEIINNAEQYSPEIVLYAFSLHPELHSDRIYIEKLLDIAKGLLVVMSKDRPDNDWVFRIFNDPYLQDETLKVLCTAVNIVMWNRYSDLVNESEFKKIMGKINNAKAVLYKNNVWANFTFGGMHIIYAPKREKYFIMTIAHELMHNVLDGIGLPYSDNLRNGIIHEFISDVAGFDIADILGFGEDAHKSRREYLRYVRHLDFVIGNEGFSTECHQGARALLEVMFLISQKTGKPIDWGKLLRISLSIVQREKIQEISSDIISLELFIKFIMKEYSDKADETITLKTIKDLFGTTFNPLLERLQQTQQPQNPIITNEGSAPQEKFIEQVSNMTNLEISAKEGVEVLSQKTLIAIFNALMDRFRKGLRENLESLGLSEGIIGQILKQGLLSIDENGQIFANRDILRLIAHIEGTNVGAILRRSLYHEKVHDLLKRKLGNEGKKRLLEDLRTQLGGNLQKVITVMEEEFGEFGKGEELNLEELLEELIVKYYTYRFRNSDSDLFDTSGALGNVGSVIVESVHRADVELDSILVIDGKVNEDSQKKKLIEVLRKSRELGGISIVKYRDTIKGLNKEIDAIIDGLNIYFGDMIGDEYEKVLGKLAENLGIPADDLRQALSKEYLDLINALTAYLKNGDGDVKKAIKLIAENAEKVEEVFKMASIVDSEDTKTIKEKITLFLGLHTLGKTGQPERPKYLEDLENFLIENTAQSGFDKNAVSRLMDYICNELNAFEKVNTEFHPTGFFNAYIELVKDTFNVPSDLIKKLIVFKYVQAVTRDEFSVASGEKPVKNGSVDELITGYLRYSKRDFRVNVVNILVPYLINPSEISISEQAGKNITDLSRGKGLLNRNWTEESLDAWEREVVDEKEVDSTVREQQVTLLLSKGLLGKSKDEVLKAYNKHAELLRKECGIDNVIDLVEKTTFAYDVNEIFGDLEISSDGKVKINTLGLTMMDLIKKVQRSVGNGNRNLFITENPLSDGQKTALIDFFKENGVIVNEDQFISVIEYDKKAHAGDNRVVAMLGKKLSEKLQKLHKKRDRVLLANQDEDENDYMLLANMAAIADIAKDVGEMKEEYRKLFKAYYKGTMGEKDIEEWVNKIKEDINGIINIILPPISPFVKAYYDALKGAREVISQAA